MKKTIQVLMLPTVNNSVGALTKGVYGKLFLPDIEYVRHNQHLYFVSDEKIKKDDWFYYGRDNIIDKYDGYFPMSPTSTTTFKVIATTDKSLGLPLIPDEFIKDYVKSNGQIKETAINCGKYGTPKVTLDTDEDFVIIGETLDEAATAWVRAYCSLNYAEYNQGVLQMKVKEAFINGANWQKQQN